MVITKGKSGVITRIHIVYNNNNHLYKKEIYIIKGKKQNRERRENEVIMFTGESK